MATTSKGRPEIHMPKKWSDRETSPERTKVWTEPKPKTERKVPVVYYLSRNGNLEHPHFIEVSLSSSEGLYLRDFVNRLNFLRGKGMANLYSWSSKRSYKNGFVWHDLSQNDFIYPAHGQEYVLKGSELLETSSSSRSQESASSSSEKSPQIPKASEDSDFSVSRKQNPSWSSLDLNEYKVYKAESTAEAALKAADAATQTDEKTRRRRTLREDQEEEEVEEIALAEETELSREEISPPPSSSSPETLESLIKADGRVLNGSIGVEDVEIRDRTADNHHHSGKSRASAVLMQLISCGSITVKESGFSLVSHYRARLPRGGSNQVSKEIDYLVENPTFAGIRLEDKEYFSGSLIETKKDKDGVAEFPTLKRSSSYNADRSSRLDLMEKEIDGVRAKCIPRKPKTAMKKEGNAISRSSVHGKVKGLPTNP